MARGDWLWSMKWAQPMVRLKLTFSQFYDLMPWCKPPSQQPEKQKSSSNGAHRIIHLYWYSAEFLAFVEIYVPMYSGFRCTIVLQTWIFCMLSFQYWILAMPLYLCCRCFYFYLEMHIKLASRQGPMLMHKCKIIISFKLISELVMCWTKLLVM